MENNKSRVLIGAVTLVAFIIAYNQHPNELKYAQTVAFATLVLAQLIHVFDCRSEHSVFHRNPFGNVFSRGGYYFVTTYASGYILSTVTTDL